MGPNWSESTTNMGGARFSLPCFPLLGVMNSNPSLRGLIDSGHPQRISPMT